VEKRKAFLKPSYAPGGMALLELRGSKQVGSVLVERMTIAGN